MTFSKTHVIDQKATSLLISGCGINQIFYSNLFLLLFLSGYLLSGLLSPAGMA